MINAGESLTGSHMPGLSEFVAKRIGLNFPEERWGDLARSVRAASLEFGFSDTDSCIEWLLSTPLTKQEMEILASHLTVGETYFFRDAKFFNALEEHVQAPLARACFILAKEFGWTPEEVSGMTIGQILLYLEMANRDGNSR